MQCLGLFFGVLAVFFAGIGDAYAEKIQKHSLDTVLGAKLLKAAESETSLTVDEKLNVYRCKMVKNYVGFEDTILGNALAYSCSKPAVGVVFYSGNDLGQHSPDKIANYIKNKFSENGMDANVFIDDALNGVSSVAFIVDGGKEVMNPTNPIKAIETIEGFAADMKLVFFADKQITSNELSRWVKAEKAYVPSLIN